MRTEDSIEVIMLDLNLGIPLLFCSVLMMVLIWILCIEHVNLMKNMKVIGNQSKRELKRMTTNGKSLSPSTLLVFEFFFIHILIISFILFIRIDKTPLITPRRLGGGQTPSRGSSSGHSTPYRKSHSNESSHV